MAHDNTADNERDTRTCDDCGHTGPKESDANDGETAVVWFEDSWTCEECKANDARSYGGSPNNPFGVGQ